MAKIVKKWPSQKILVGIDSECFITYFWPKISKSKIFSRVKFFRGSLSFFCQNVQNSEKMTKSKNFGRFFWSESIQNVSKCFFNWKSRNQQFFPCKNFFLGLAFFGQNGQNSEKWQSKMILIDFLVVTDLEYFKTYFKPKISKSANFSRVKFFLGTVVFGKNCLNSERLNCFGANLSQPSFDPV